MSSSEHQLKVMVLGFSAVGKTYFLGSLAKLGFDLGPRGFALRNKAFHVQGQLSEIYDVIAEINEGKHIKSTRNFKHAQMVMKQGVDSLFELKITDIEGQALNPGQNEEIAKELKSQIGDYDALILILKAPADGIECQQCMRELAQMLDFASILLSQDATVPVTLVINKIDLLPKLQNVKQEIEKEFEEMRASLEGEHGDRRRARKEAISRKGELVNKFVKRALDTDEIDAIIEQFERWIKSSRSKIPNRIFPCTTLGFDNAQENPADTSTYISKVKILEPFGTVAAFLWALQARIRLAGQDEDLISKILKRIKPDNLANELLEDVSRLHSIGEAYCDNDRADWSLRNLNNLYMIEK